MEFTQIAAHPRYEISKDGVIRHIVTKRISTQRISPLGYINIRIRYLGKNKQISVHRLLAITFIPNPNNYSDINHIDGNKQNNNLDNLEWCTRQHNILHAYRNGLMSKVGEKNTKAILKNTDIPVIRKMLANGIFQKDIAKMYGVCQVAISNINVGKNWSHL